MGQVLRLLELIKSSTKHIMCELLNLAPHDPLMTLFSLSSDSLTHIQYAFENLPLKIPDLVGNFKHNGQETYFWNGVPEAYLHDQILDLEEQLASSSETTATLRKRIRTLRRQNTRKLNRQRQQLQQVHEEQVSQLQQKLQNAIRRSDAYRKRAVRTEHQMIDISQEKEWAEAALIDADEMQLEQMEESEQESLAVSQFIEMATRRTTGTPGRLVLLAQKLFVDAKSPLSAIGSSFNTISQELFQAQLQGLSRSSISDQIAQVDKINYFVQRCLCQNKPIGLMLDISKVSVMEDRRICTPSGIKFSLKIICSPGLQLCDLPAPSHLSH